jgi:hypothetical protein
VRPPEQKLPLAQRLVLQLAPPQRELVLRELPGPQLALMSQARAASGPQPRLGQ